MQESCLQSPLDIHPALGTHWGEVLPVQLTVSTSLSQHMCEIYRFLHNQYVDFKCSKIQHGKINMKLNWKTMNHLLPTLAFSPPSYLHFALFVLAV